MLWYGKNYRLRTFICYKRSIKRFNNLEKRTAFKLVRKSKLTKTKVYYYLPATWSKVILKSKVGLDTHMFYMFNENYYFKVSVNKHYLKMFWDSNTNVLAVGNYYESSFLSFYKKLFNNLLRSFSYWFFTKLRIKGKGYYVYKNSRNTITHQFGHSHRRYIYAYFTWVKFLSKTVVLLAGSSKSDLFLTGRNIQNSKYMNIFTGRGVRFAKQIVYKKTGKVSAYR